jgi:hypothetical protein
VAASPASTDSIMQGGHHIQILNDHKRELIDFFGNDENEMV